MYTHIYTFSPKNEDKMKDIFLIITVWSAKEPSSGWREVALNIENNETGILMSAICSNSFEDCLLNEPKGSISSTHIYET